jgi:hypothetical protein
MARDVLRVPGRGAAAWREATVIQIVSGGCGVEVARRRLLRRCDFDRLRLGGAFDDVQVELLAGVVAEVGEDGEHDGVAARVAARLRAGGTVQLQAPLALDPYSLPRPDVAVLVPRPDGRMVVRLIVEVAAQSRDKDRTVKAELYGRAAVGEYWMVDLREHRIERWAGRDPILGTWTVREVVTGGAPAICAADPRLRLAYASLRAVEAPGGSGASVSPEPRVAAATAGSVG